jgi:Fur family ferric uptake transcriptional regulator
VSAKPAGAAKKGRKPATPALADDIMARLRASGGRVTATRRATVEVLLSAADRHLNAEQIVDAVRARLPDVAGSTIYRTLAALEDLAVISHVHLDHGPATFHFGDRTHRHLVCRHCHTIIETPADLFADLAEDLDRRYGFSIIGEHFALAGECRACRQQPIEHNH